MTVPAAPGGAAIGAVPPGFARRTALVAGAFYLVTFVASIPAAVLLGPVLK
jgi:hypothetical protein